MSPSTETPESAMKPTAAEIENGSPRASSATTPPTIANGTPAKTRTLSRTLPVGEVQQREDERERERHHDHEAALGALEVLELPAEPDEVARRQLDVPRDPLPHLGHEAAEVAPAHVRLDDEAPLRPLALDRRRPGDLADRGEPPERDAVAARRAHQDRGELRRIVPVLVPEAHREVEAPLALADLPG